MRQRFFTVFSGLAAAAALSGCATMFDHTTQAVEVYTPGVEQVDCILDTPEQRYRLLTPNKVRVEKSRFDIVVTCTKSGYEDAIRTLSPTLSGNVFWNVLNGVIPGTSYDMMSHAVYKYPDKVVIEMMPLETKGVVFEPVEESESDEATSAPEPEAQTPAPANVPATEPAVKPYAASDADRAFDAGKK